MFTPSTDNSQETEALAPHTSEAVDIGQTQAASYGTIARPHSSEDGAAGASSTLQWQLVKQEMVAFINSSLPITLSAMSQLLMMMPLVVAVSGLGTAALAAMNLVAIYAGLCGISPLMGIALALDTMCSQAYTAAKNKYILGIYLQRGLVCSTVVQALIYPLWWNSARIYEYFGVPAEIAEITGKLLRVYFFGVAALVVYEYLKSFLFAQGIRRFAVVNQAVCVPFGWLLTWLLVANKSTSIGILGAAFTVLGVALGLNLLTLVFILKVDGHKCWGGFSRAAFTDLKPMLKMSLAGSLLSFFDSIAMHMINLGSLFLGAETIAAQAVLGNLAECMGILSAGFSITACNRIGNMLGSGLPSRAVLSMYTAVGTTVCVFAMIAGLLVSNRTSVSGIFSQDPTVVQVLTSHIPLAAAAGAIQGAITTFNGVFRGQGRQALVARIRMLSFVGVGIPFALIGVKLLDWKLAGLWFGYISCLLTVLCSQIYVISITNWDTQVDRCQKRVASALLATSHASGIGNEPILP